MIRIGIEKKILGLFALFLVATAGCKHDAQAPAPVTVTTTHPSPSPPPDTLGIYVAKMGGVRTWTGTYHYQCPCSGIDTTYLLNDTFAVTGSDSSVGIPEPECPVCGSRSITLKFSSWNDSTIVFSYVEPGREGNYILYYFKKDSIVFLSGGSGSCIGYSEVLSTP